MIGHRTTCITAISTFALALVGLSTPLAQSTATGNVPGEKIILREGSDVKLKFAQELSSKTAAEGDRVDFVLEEDLAVGNAIVARAGAKAVGSVTNVKKAGMMGKAGELNVRLEHLKVGDIKVRLRGSKGKEGDSKTGTAVALTVLFGPIGLIKHGKDIVVKEGSPLAAYVDDDVAMIPLATVK